MKTSLSMDSPSRKAVLMSIQLMFHLFCTVSDSINLKVSFEQVGDCISDLDRQSSSIPQATSLAFGFKPSLVCFAEHTHLKEMHG